MTNHPELKMFSDAESLACHHLVKLALEEDIGGGDLTTQALIPADLQGRAVFVARARGVLSGLPAAAILFQSLDSRIHFEPLMRDGQEIGGGNSLAVVTGPLRAILPGERIALNFVQHLSGVATQTRRYLEAVAGLNCKILDTRKTLPGWRRLEKYAVRCGGGFNHRVGLYDGILIKDNHLVALGKGKKEIRRALDLARARAAAGVPVEIEVENLDELDEALGCLPNLVLLDNMSLQEIREAVRRRHAMAPSTLLEVSGGVTLATVRDLAETGVDRISIGALTHSAPTLDIALDFERKSIEF
jgi:nicotinate-nucleotide pyrophosphorylase (carboxylating)